MHSSALLAIAQDGQPLAREHGFPCRLRLPALYGMLNPKWVTSIELVDHLYDGYWPQQGWSPTAIVRTESRIDAPRHARVGKPTWIAGIAWAGIRGIRAVEVSLDDGRSWQPARMHKPLSPVGVDAMGLPLDATNRRQPARLVPGDRRHRSRAGPDAASAPPVGRLRLSPRRDRGRLSDAPASHP
jgi:Oxidoreductase molybdopterin binding domain/Mo-co oxidoreductase dimerisation domain